MASSAQKNKKQKRQHPSRLARGLFALNAVGFGGLLLAVAYHISDLIVNFGYNFASLNWASFVWLIGGHALLLTWHHRVVFTRVYRAIDGLHTHLLIFLALVGLMWSEFLSFAEIRGNTLQDRVIVTLIWGVVLLLHAGYIHYRQSRSAQTQATTQPDISRLVDSDAQPPSVTGTAQQRTATALREQ